MLLVLLAACGGSEATPSPSAEASLPAETPVVTTAPVTEEPPGATEAPTAGTVRLGALCAGVAIRKGPSVDDDVLVRVAKGTKVRVVETVAGGSYEAGACGSSGSDWLKIDRVAGKAASKLYGVPYVYAAAGFFE
jgi:hypothetical protein